MQVVTNKLQSALRQLTKTPADKDGPCKSLRCLLNGLLGSLTTGLLAEMYTQIPTIL